MIQKTKICYFSAKLLTIGSLSVHATDIIENRIVFKNFDIDSPEFQNVVNFYKKKPYADLKKLVEYFEYIPEEQKREAVKSFLSSASGEFKVRFAYCKYTEDGVITETPYKTKRTISLEDKLLGNSINSNYITK